MKKHEILTIGTAERISFPELELYCVPAKIDTGADSSAVWASDIRVSADGHLSFMLFGEGSRYYTGQRIVTSKFRKSLVKNTSGIAEARFKVSLQVKIGERKIRAWFNLSDRSAMRYPVLLGRRLLHNKFIVDVSKRYLYSDNPNVQRVLVLGAPASRVAQFFDEVAEMCEERVVIEARSFNELLAIASGDGVRVIETIGGRDIASYDLVYFKTHRRNYEFAIAAAEYLEHRHVRFIDTELAKHTAYDKLTEMIRLALNHLPIPETFCASSEVLISMSEEIVAQIGEPFVCKEINADRGKQNYLLQTSAELRDVLRQTQPGERYMVQRYVPNDGYLRALVLGPEVALLVGRHAVRTTDSRKAHLNNPAGGANAYLVESGEEPDEARGLALAAARLMRRQVAGVDLLCDKNNGQWYILEVNAAPQIRSGSFPDRKAEAFAKFIDLQLNR